MAIQPIIKNGKYTGQLDSGGIAIPAGTVRTKFWINVDNVEKGSGTQRAAIMWSPDNTTWQTLTTVTIEAPPDDAPNDETGKPPKNFGRMEHNFWQTTGFFRVTADLPGLVTVDASVETYTE